MSEDSNVPSNPTGEVRPRSHKLPRNKRGMGSPCRGSAATTHPRPSRGLLRVALCSQQEHPGHGTGATWEMSGKHEAGKHGPLVRWDLLERLGAFALTSELQLQERIRNSTGVLNPKPLVRFKPLVVRTILQACQVAILEVIGRLPAIKDRLAHRRRGRECVTLWHVACFELNPSNQGFCSDW